MTSAWSGVARAGATVLAGSGLVYAAMQVPFTASLGPAVEQAPVAAAAVTPVESASLLCPGPESEGLPGVPPVTGATTVYAAAAPAAALQDVALAGGGGSLTLTPSSAGAAPVTVDRRGPVGEVTLGGTSVAEVSATGAVAPGLAALQTTLVPEGDDRALVAAACASARPDLWLVAGSGGSTRRERVVLANPGANPVTADVTVLGAGGLLPSANGQSVTVPPGGRASLLVDALVGPEQTPVVHVVATGGVLTGVLEDSWVDGAVGRGADDAVPAAEPSGEQVLPAVVVDGPARLRVAVPGADEAVVQARALTADGPIALPGDGVLRVPGSSVRELDLAGLPAGAYAIQVRADHPVVAGAVAERRADPSDTGRQSDFGWTTSTAPIPLVAGTPLPPGASGSVVLVATGEESSATVYTVSEQGAVDARPYSLSADSIATLDLGAARQVWVRRTAGTIRAGVSLSLSGPGPDPLFSLVPLSAAPVSATQVPVRQVPN